MLRFFCFSLFFILCFSVHAASLTGDSAIAASDTLTICPATKAADSIPAKPKSISFKSKKIIAAVLAFPLPFGILGLHRIFLGTKPYIPFAYLGTLGGCVGLLPLIDFIAILSAKEATLKLYENNPRVFMWSH